MNNNELIEHLLSIDVIKDAEKTCKAKYELDKLTQEVAAVNFVKRNIRLTKELKVNKDTYKGISYLNLINVVMEEGFNPVLNETFQGKDWGGRKITEVLLAFYHETKGILLVAESFGGSLVNKAQMYYNWVPNQLDKDWQRAISTGGFEKTGLVWAGSHDISQAFKYKLEVLHKKGYFVQQWVLRPIHMLITNYSEETIEQKLTLKGYNETKLQKLPEHVRKAILA